MARIVLSSALCLCAAGLKIEGRKMLVRKAVAVLEGWGTVAKDLQRGKEILETLV